MPESAKPRVAVVGLGSMGFGMATSLRRAGLKVTGCDVSGDAVARFVADGGLGAKTPAEAAWRDSLMGSWTGSDSGSGFCRAKPILVFCNACSSLEAR